MKDDVVLADEVYHLGIFTLPILLPIGRKILSSRYIAYRSIEPNIENLTLGTLDRNRNTPIEIPTYGKWWKTDTQTTIAPPAADGDPLLMSLENPT